MNSLKQSALSVPYLHRASVDSIRLRYEATIPPNTIPDLNVRRNKQSHLLWHDLEGKGVYGTCGVTKVELDGCAVRFEPRRFKRGEPLSLSVWLSVPSWKHGHNAAPVDAPTLRALSQWIGEEAETLGVYITAETARVCEVHFFRDGASPRPFARYEPVSRPMQPLNNRIWVDGPLYIKRGNKTYGWAVYSKKHNSLPLKGRRGGGRERELEERFRTLEQQGVRDVLRFEWRVAGAKAVRDSLGSDSLQHLIDTYNELDDLLDRKMEKDLFVIEAPALSPSQLWASPVQDTSVSVADKWRSILSGDNPKAALLAYAIDTGRTELAQESWGSSKGGVAKSRKSLDALFKEIMGGSAQIKSIQELAAKGRQTRLYEGGATWGELYAELRAIAMARPITLSQIPSVPLPAPATRKTTAEHPEQMAA